VFLLLVDEMGQEERRLKGYSSRRGKIASAAFYTVKSRRE
jgi:hypothetical protein